MQPALLGVLLGLAAVLLTLRLGNAGRREEPPMQTIMPFATDVTDSAPAAPTPAESPEPTAAAAPDPALAAALEELVQTQPGRWSLYYAPLPEGEPVTAATDGKPFVSASLIKLFIMGAAYEQMEQGQLERETVEPLLRAMITVSDNASANRLILLLGEGDAENGMAAVNAWCVACGYADTRLNRLMLAENDLQNYTSAADCAAFLTQVYRGACVSPEASREMLALLLEQKVNDRLPARLPTGTPVAHKTGDLSGLSCCDAGIVFSPGGDYLLCVLCNDPPSDQAARDAIAALSEGIYAIVNP